jgi:hypothetical protein
MRGGFRGSKAGSLIHAGRGSVVLFGGGGLSRSLLLICWAFCSTPPARCTQSRHDGRGPSATTCAATPESAAMTRRACNYTRRTTTKEDASR